VSNKITFKCPHCLHFIDKEVDTYYRKKRNKEIAFLQAKIKRMRIQLAIYHSKERINKIKEEIS